MKKSKRIALVELYGHYEVLFGISAGMVASGWGITILSTSVGFQEAPKWLTNAPVANWIIKAQEQSIPDFLNVHKNQLEDCQLVYWITIASHFSFFASFLLSKPTVLLLHNGRYWLEPREAIKLRNFFDCLRFVREELNRNIFWRNQIVQQTNFLAFPTEEIRHFMVSRKLVSWEKTCPAIPFVPFEGESPTTGLLPEQVIVIPGILTNESRNYQPVLNAFKKLGPNLRSPVKLILLGKPKKKAGFRLAGQFERLRFPWLSCQVFYEYVPQPVFDEWLQRTDFLILPLRSDMRYGIYEELGGQTKISGSINDMVRFGKPALVSADYQVAPALKDHCQSYSDTGDLAEKLYYWLTTRAYKKLQDQLVSELRSKWGPLETGRAFSKWWVEKA